jgi:hypothetical protein
MNYQKIYENLIQKIKSENRKKLKKDDPNYVYYEKHHIVPYCMSKCDDESNKILLTAREHFIAHKLLIFIYPHDRKLALAFHKMTFGNNNIKYIPSARDYAYARELISNTPMSEETKKKISEGNSGEKNGQWGKPGTRLGIKDSEETRKKKSERMRGEKNPQWGMKGELSTTWKIKYSEESLKRMSEAQKKRFSNKENHPLYGKRKINGVWIKIK